MSDVVKLLPDSVANQIAAGEVIQRPASAVKELLENAIDAGAAQIKLIVRDGGKTLIQVVDDGTGMSETDARLCFERHATSKISRASDLFSVYTLGFRGEALASIAAIAMVELKTRTEEQDMGTEVIVEGSVTKSQAPCQCPVGTSISVKNLFFNTPARRNFLKSDAVEKSHISSEFIRVALARPDISLSFYQNNQLTHQLEKGNLKQRIAGIFGNHYNQRLVPVEESTEIVSINGFVLKPSYARKKRGEQFFFVNRRFIRSPYLNHAIEQAFQELIPDDMFPSFFLFLETDPAQIDVNVHPTKTEIKFQDEKYIYQILKVAVKRSLGKYNVTPSLDFERETAFDNLPPIPPDQITPPGITVNPDFNPFDVPANRGNTGGGNLSTHINPRQWEKLFPEKGDKPVSVYGQKKQQIINPEWDVSDASGQTSGFINLQNRYILSTVKSGLMLIDRQRAHERILFERYLKKLSDGQKASQQLLFPEHIHMIDPDTGLLQEILPALHQLGFEISELKKNTFVVHAVPVELSEHESIQDLIEGMMEQYKKNQLELKHDHLTNLARSLAKKLSLKPGKAMGDAEMSALADALFACQMPYLSPAGKPTVSILSLEELSEKLK